MDSQPTIRIVVKDSHKRRDPLDPEDTVVWHTLDRLEGYVIIQTSALLMFDKTDMRLEGIRLYFVHASGRGVLKPFLTGHSRVWIKVMGEGSSISSVKASRNVSGWPKPVFGIIDLLLEPLLTRLLAVLVPIAGSSRY
jgi:hypothetical protein